MDDSSATEAERGGAPGAGGDAEAPPNAAFYYHPDGYDTGREKLVGRHSAGEGYLRGFVRHSGVETFYCLAHREPHWNHFTKQLRALAPDARAEWIRRDERGRLAEPGCLFVPGPGLGAEFAWTRRRHGDAAWSLCGVTHTTATHAIMDAMRDIILDPVQEWDAVICTSRVVKHSMGQVLEGFKDYYGARLGARSFTLPQMPVIPLGVDCDAFGTDPAARAEWRKQLGAGEEDVIVLFLGRLSFFEKAHPLAMYQALARAAEGSKRQVHLVEAGWFPNDKIEDSFQEAIKATLGKVKHHFLDGRKPEVRHRIWSAADVFCSLSDNIQETFGLTPIEGMAAGLPVVVTDWDGYKDTVRDGVDGFRIPTVTAGPGLAQDLADRYFESVDAYGRYCGYASQLTAVDVAACTRAFAALIESPERRRDMGEAGRRRARELLDWSVVIPQYQALWRELAERRRAAAPETPRWKSHPGRLCPLAVFRSYPSAHVRAEDMVSLAPGADEATLRARSGLEMVKFARDVLPPAKDTLAVIRHLAKAGPTPAGKLLEVLPQSRRRAMARGLVWLYKLDLIRIDCWKGVDLAGLRDDPL